jgi:hypothetical protein
MMMDAKITRDDEDGVYVCVRVYVREYAWGLAVDVVQNVFLCDCYIGCIYLLFFVGWMRCQTDWANNWRHVTKC